MAIKPYEKSSVSIAVSEQLVNAYLDGVQSKTLLTALGDYWTDYYVDADTLAVIATGATALYSQEYSKMLDYVLASNIIDIPVSKPVAYKLYVFSEDYFTAVEEGGKLAYYEVDFPDVQDVEYLVSSLFEPEVVLEGAKHFELVDGKLRFYVDIFNDEGITNYAYSVGAIPHKQVLLWATNIAFDDYLIYDRYGVFLYRKEKDSDAYHWLITALLHYYTNTKSLERIEAVLNVLYGLPISRFSGEVVTAIDYVDSSLSVVSLIENSAYFRVTTTKYTYYVFSYSDLLVSVGQTLENYQLIGRFHIAQDYITHPTWYLHTKLPTELIEGPAGGSSFIELMDRVLKYNIVYVKMVLTYETMPQFKQQLVELYEIIKSGFPVYLYPFVDYIFRAVFYDTVLTEDDFKLGVAREDGTTSTGIKFKNVELYERCFNGTFSGKTRYFSDPALDHGSKYADFGVVGQPKAGEVALYNSKIKYSGSYIHTPDVGPIKPVVLQNLYHLRFNGASNYNFNDDSPNWHRPTPSDAPKFNSEYKYGIKADAPADAPLYTHSHNCGADTVNIGINVAVEDEYDWNASGSQFEGKYIHPRYDSQSGHEGTIKFSKRLISNNYTFKLAYKEKTTDYVDTYVDEMGTVCAMFNTVDMGTNSKYFNGGSQYNVQTGHAGYFTDNFELTIHTK